MSDATREAAAAIMGDVATDEVEQPAEPAAEQQQHEAETTEDVALPDEIRELLDQPDLDMDDDEDDEPISVVDVENDSEDYLEPEQAAKLKRELVRERKRREHVEQLRVRDNEKKWRGEAERYFKYADVDTIKATSRRGFLKQAEQQHNAIKAKVEKALAQEREQLQQKAAQERTDAREEAREAWGQPVETHGSQPNVKPQEDRAAALRRGRLNEATKSRLTDPDDPVHKAFFG
jgi:thiol:disulfide interchange protein